MSASQPLAASPSQRELRTRRAKTDAHQMDVDESSGNDTEEDEPYLMNPREGSDDESERDDMVEDEGDGDDGGDGDSEDSADESDAGSSDLEGPLVTPAIQIPVRQAG